MLLPLVSMASKLLLVGALYAGPANADDAKSNATGTSDDILLGSRIEAGGVVRSGSRFAMSLVSLVATGL